MTLGGRLGAEMSCEIDELEPTQPELELIDAASEGTVCDFAPDEEIDATTGDFWFADREVRANLIAALATTNCAKHPVHYRGLRLRGARITGALDLQDATLEFPLWLDYCYFEGWAALRFPESVFCLFHAASCRFS
jgi:hypothetical protein